MATLKSFLHEVIELSMKVTLHSPSSTIEGAEDWFWPHHSNSALLLIYNNRTHECADMNEDDSNIFANIVHKMFWYQVILFKIRLFAYTRVMRGCTWYSWRVFAFLLTRLFGYWSNPGYVIDTSVCVIRTCAWF